MTPEPAQPAESPEVRAQKYVLQGDYRMAYFAMCEAYGHLTASTARPTERGAVEDYKLPCDVHLPPATVIRAGCDLSTLKLAMEADYRPRHFDGHPNKCLPPTDQAAEVEARAAWFRRNADRGRRDAFIHVDPVYFASECADAIMAGTLATQPATGRTMGGEDGLREALREARLQLEYMDQRSPSGTTPAVIARIDAALQNGGE